MKTIRLFERCVALLVAAWGVTAWMGPAAEGAQLVGASLRNGDYGSVLGTSPLRPGQEICAFKSAGSWPSTICTSESSAVTSTAEGTTFLATETNGRSYALINWEIQDNPTMRSTGTISFWFKAARGQLSAIGGSIFGDNYGFNRFCHGQGTFGISAGPLTQGTGDPADDQVSVSWTTSHQSVFHGHGSTTLEYDTWYNLGFTWRDAPPAGGHQFELWVNGGLVATHDLPAGFTFPWGLASPESGYNMGLGDNHQRGYDDACDTPSGGARGYNSAAGVTFANLRIWNEYRAAGDTIANGVPTADAGADQNAAEGDPVTLDGSGSSDPEQAPLTYQWVQIGGPAVALSDAAAATPTFTAPLVGPGGATIVFELTVTDGNGADSDTVEIAVGNVNRPPTADAGPNQSVGEGSPVTLSGAASDPDDDPLVISWSQLSGPPVVLAGADTLTPSFTAPLVGPEGAKLKFRLTADDGNGGVATDKVAVLVGNLSDAPNCGVARPSAASLWPPLQQPVLVRILGLIDSDGDPLAVALTRITQDEPVRGLTARDMGPDAWIAGSVALLRAQRSGNGNGRVYRIEFTATDAGGATCLGAVTIGVPLRKGEPAIDDGQRFASTEP